MLHDLREAKYYSVTVDSTPDVSHTDQLKFVVRYVQQNGKPVEHFLIFIQLEGHKSAVLEETDFTVAED